MSKRTMFGGWRMPAYFFRGEPGAAELRRLARRESGRVCQRVLMIANMLEGMEHEGVVRLTHHDQRGLKAGGAITLPRLRFAIRSPLRLERSAALIARRDGVES